jgi:hypothetical protein
MVNRARVRPLNQARPGQGPVIYWVSRDQRVRDNWALLYAQELALSPGQPLGVVFCLAPAFLGAILRQYGFMLKGLQDAARHRPPSPLSPGRLDNGKDWSMINHPLTPGKSPERGKVPSAGPGAVHLR